MSVVEADVEFSQEKSPSDEDHARCGRGTRMCLLFLGGVLLATALTASIAIITSVLYRRSHQEDGFVTYEYLDAPHAASMGVLDFQEENGATRQEKLYINDVTREQTIHVTHPYYDIFILKKFNEGREMFLVTTKPEAGQQRRVIECEETNMTDTEYIQSSLLVNTPLTQPVEVTIAKSFKETSQPIKLAYKSCDQIPPKFFKEQECSFPSQSIEGALRTKRQSWHGESNQQSSYGNWGGKWRDNKAPFPRCCNGCQDRQQCTALSCAPPLDALDQAAMDYTFCTNCWRQTPTQDLPHCDCIKDLMNDLNGLRCPHDNYRACYLYRSNLKGLMASHKCWGRLVTKWYKVYHCGYKQTKCNAGRCQIKPEYCVKGKTKVRNNFKCENYLTCEESTRQLSGGGAAVMTNQNW